MVPTTDKLDARQVDFEGKKLKRGRIKYRKLFAKRSRRKHAELVGSGAESEPERRIIEWLQKHSIVFEAHGVIHQSTTHVDVNSILDEILSTFSLEQRELLVSRLKLRVFKGNRFMGRYDFKVEGTNRATRKPEAYYIEYWGMYNPKIQVTKENMRRLYNRLLIDYTLIKKPIKEKYYASLGLKLISLTRADLKNQVLDDKLGSLLNLEQRQLISRFI